jgi:hypothetical protein
VLQQIPKIRTSLLSLLLISLPAHAGFAPGELRIVPGTSWQWQLSSTLNTARDVELYDIDLLDHDAETITALKNQGRIVICYFSAGTYENFRDDVKPCSEDSSGLCINDDAISEALEDYPDEFWLDVRDSSVRDYVSARLDTAVTKGCDGVEPDNVDAFSNDSGFDLSSQDQIAFNEYIAAEAHARNLSVGLKNALDIIPDLVDDFDWALNEQCAQYKECALLEPFIAADKAVFQAEYKRVNKARKCRAAAKRGFDLVFYPLSLNGKRYDCP